MALTAGTPLGPYEVVAHIGAGGMGEVYEATDTNLKRTAAIKVLPASVAVNAERLARASSARPKCLGKPGVWGTLGHFCSNQSATELIVR